MTQNAILPPHLAKLKSLPKGLRFDMPKFDGSPVFRADVQAGVIEAFSIVGDDDFNTRTVADALRRIGNRPVTLKINSPGGDFFEGIAISNLLAEHRQSVTVKIYGLAASAASLIAMSGKRIEVAKSSSVMLHNVWAIVAGDADAMSDARDLLESFNKVAVSIYANRTGLPADTVIEMMAAETWLNADEAIAKGFADATFEAGTRRMRKTENSGNTRDVREAERALREAGFSKSQAKRAASAAVKAVSPETQKIEAERIAAKARAVAASLRR